MDRVPYEIRLSGPGHFGREAPPSPVGQFLSLTGPTVKRAILLGFVGRSSPPGRPRAWVDRAADIRFVGISGEPSGATVLHLEAPRFGEAAEELYRQAEFWPTKPAGDDTGFDLLGDILADVAGHKADSERFDAPFLRRLGHFDRVLARGIVRATLSGHRLGADSPAVLDEATLENARRLKAETPPPRRVRVAGKLDMIRVSSGGFELILDDGTPARGVLVDGDITARASLAGSRVLVQGEVVYRPSGRLLRIDARSIEHGTDAPAIWSKVPPPQPRRLDLKAIRRPQTPSSGVSAFFGTWPGDETDEEWGEMIEGLS